MKKITFIMICTVVIFFYTFIIIVKLMVLTSVMELLKIQTRMVICWYLIMLKMELYIIIYQKILKKLLGKIKLDHLFIFQMGKVLIFLLSRNFYWSCHKQLSFLFLSLRQYMVLSGVSKWSITYLLLLLFINTLKQLINLFIYCCYKLD